MKRFKNILMVCGDLSATEDAFERVRWLAKANGAMVTLMDIVDAEPGTLARMFAALPGARVHEIEDQVLEVHRARLERLAEPLRADGIVVRKTVQQGIPFVQVIRRVLRENHDLVIKGAQLDADGLLFKGADMHLLRKCPCPVWIVKSQETPRSKHILAAVDPNPDETQRHRLSQMVMELATSLAREDDAKVTVINTWRVQEESTLRHGLIKMQESEITSIIEREKEDSAEKLSQLMSGFADEGIDIRVLHLKGIAGEIIPEFVRGKNIDTVVMGTVGRTGVAGVFIGNTAETILNRVACSVVAVKPPNFTSPVE
ncbi:universal stress protein [Litoreibacter roseus]|uniref:Universal stress protein n=1 Tax=Litoreibacter roseus TaxID=2601869 RepID=A0A6N6JDE9_9RHOB|nr:universal stress protein [Litoreibacter roseus]GFE64175.1 universal stress protein [Litoreibacter roseus]